MDFTKMHGLGNDFIVVTENKVLPEEAKTIAVSLCDRNFGIGADGLVYILPSEHADFQMRIFNADGTEAEQCGNAVRCAAKYVYDHGLTRSTKLTVETIGAGIQPLALTVERGKVMNVKVDMGVPILEGLKIPTMLDQNPILEQPLLIEQTEWRFSAVSMGNPHCIIYVEDAVHFDLHKWGPIIEKHPMFPHRTNVEFVSVIDRTHLKMRVWERGVGPTLACGTGACASLVASVLNGLADRRATVSLAGGDLSIEWDEVDGHVYMTGPAAEVFTGKLSSAS